MKDPWRRLKDFHSLFGNWPKTKIPKNSPHTGLPEEILCNQPRNLRRLFFEKIQLKLQSVWSKACTPLFGNWPKQILYCKSNPEHTIGQLQGNRQHQRDPRQSMTEIIKRLHDFISKNVFNLMTLVKVSKHLSIIASSGAVPRCAKSVLN